MRKLPILALLLIAFQSALLAQTGRKEPTDKEDRKEDRKEAIDERKAKNKEKVDYNLFRRQMLSLKEFAEERKKIPELQKQSKGVVKIVAYVDSLDADDGKNRSLVGYICEVVGDNATNVYEATYDRTTKKIINVKQTQEGAELEKEAAATKSVKGGSRKTAVKKTDDEDADVDEKKAEKKPTAKKAAPKKKTDDDDAEEQPERKPTVKKAAPKKKTDDDEEEEEEEEKPVRKKQKDDEED